MKRIKPASFFLILAIFFLYYPTSGQVVRFVNKEWKVFDKESGQLYDQPYEKKLPVHLLVNKRADDGLYLFITTAEDISIYIDNAFYKEAKPKKALIIKLDSIFEARRKESAIISVYGNFNHLLIDSTCMLANSQRYKVLSHVSRSPFVQRDNIKSYFALMFLFCLAFFSVVYNMYPRNFDQYFNVSDFMLNYKVDAVFLRSSIEGHYLTASLLGCFFFSLAGIDLPFLSNTLLAQSFLSFFQNFVYFFFLSVCFYCLKFMVIRLLSWIFSLEKYAMLHFKIFVRISVLWSVFLAALGVFNQAAIIDQKVLISLFALFSLFFLTMISIKVSVLINRVARVSTLYLISYLCITEWLPYLVILKLYEKYFS